PGLPIGNAAAAGGSDGLPTGWLVLHLAGVTGGDELVQRVGDGALAGPAQQLGQLGGAEHLVRLGLQRGEDLAPQFALAAAAPGRARRIRRRIGGYPVTGGVAATSRGRTLAVRAGMRL